MLARSHSRLAASGVAAGSRRRTVAARAGF
jgi:hypothetical protein